MILRMTLAAAALAASVTAATAAIGDCYWAPTPDPVNFPRPMPSKLPPPNLADWWHSIGEWLEPKLGPVTPGDWSM